MILKDPKFNDMFNKSIKEIKKERSDELEDGKKRSAINNE